MHCFGTGKLCNVCFWRFCSMPCFGSSGVCCSACVLYRPPTISVSATTPGTATEVATHEVLSAWQMRTNYIEYHLRLQEQRPKQGKLFAQEYPEPSLPQPVVEPSEPSAEYSFGSSQEIEVASTASTQTTTVAQTVFNVVGHCLTLVLCGLLSFSALSVCRCLSVSQIGQSLCCRQICLSA